MPWDPSRPFTWRDGERLVVFGRGRTDDLAEIVREPFVLLTTPRAAARLPALERQAESVHHVVPGHVDRLAAALRGAVRGGLLVAVGGGRVIDVAKALAAAEPPRRVVAVPTTLSGAEMTAIHRLATGTPAGRTRVRPSVVVTDPALLEGMPDAALAASAMNALGHAVEAPLTPRANPVATMSAEAACALLRRGMGAGPPDLDALALGALLAGAAIGSAGYGLHHVVAQTLAREAGVGHGPANAAMLPHSLQALRTRFGDRVDPSGDLLALAREGARRAGAERLRDLGVGRDVLGRIAAEAVLRGELAETPPPATVTELQAMYEAAW